MKKYIEIRFNSNDDLPLERTIELLNKMIIVRSPFLGGKTLLD